MSKTIIEVDSQRLTAMQSCTRKAKYAFVDHLVPIDKSLSLSKGKIVHDILDHHYKCKKASMDKKDILQECMAIGRKKVDENGLDSDTSELILHTYQMYHRYYEYESWVPLFIEKPFWKKMYEDDDTIIYYTGVIDLVVQTQEGRYLVDHKTAQRIYTPYKLSNQFMGYIWATGLTYFYVNQIGLHSITTKKPSPPEKRFKRPLLDYRKEAIDAWKESAIFSILEFTRLHDAGYYPRRYSGCEGKFGPCPFHKICSSPADEAYFASTEFKIKKWDPTKGLE